MKKFIAAFALFGLALAGPAIAKVKAKSPRPALWKLADSDTTLYLFGTIHLLPKDLKWRSPKLENAIAQSQELVVEVGNLDDIAAVGSAFANAAFSSNLQPIKKRFPSNKHAALSKLIEKSGIPESTYDKLEDWAAAISLAQGLYKDMGLSFGSGPESHLLPLFRAAKKPVSGLETAEDQFRAFDTLSPAAQKYFLGSILDESSDPNAEFDAMIKAWTKGDEKGIALSFDDELQQSPELIDALFRKRNASWTTQLAARLAKPGTVFVAVGAGHLAGKDSVPNMLRKRGLKVSRIQ